MVDLGGVPEVKTASHTNIRSKDTRFKNTREVDLMLRQFYQIYWIVYHLKPHVCSRERQYAENQIHYQV